MKRIVVLILIISFSYASIGQSIAPEDTNKKQMMMLSVSPMPMTLKMLDLFTSYGYNNFAVIPGDFGVKGVAYEPKISGLFTFAYGRYIDTKVLLKLNVSYLQLWRKWDLYVDAHSPHYYTERIHFFQVMPEIRYDYYKRKYIDLFFAVGLGVNYSFDKRGDYKDVIPSQNGIGLAFQIWAFGLEFKPIDNLLVRLNALGFGAIGPAEIGIGYRF